MPVAVKADICVAVRWAWQVTEPEFGVRPPPARLPAPLARPKRLPGKVAAGGDAVVHSVGAASTRSSTLRPGGEARALLPLPSVGGGLGLCLIHAKSHIPHQINKRRGLPVAGGAPEGLGEMGVGDAASSCESPWEAGGPAVSFCERGHALLPRKGGQRVLCSQVPRAY